MSITESCCIHAPLAFTQKKNPFANASKCPLFSPFVGDDMLMRYQSAPAEGIIGQRQWMVAGGAKNVEMGL
jgi:hypothetical protein